MRVSGVGGLQKRGKEGVPINLGGHPALRRTHPAPCMGALRP